MADNPISRHKLFGMQPVLAVHDVQETLQFYRDKFGFEIDFVEGDPPVHARVVADPDYSAPTVHIRFVPLTSSGSAESATVELWIHVATGIDDLYNQFMSRGVKSLSAPEQKPWGLRMFSVEDCNGFRLHFGSEGAG